MSLAHKQETLNLRRRATRPLFRSTSRETVEDKTLLRNMNAVSATNLLTLHQSFDSKK